MRFILFAFLLLFSLNAQAQQGVWNLNSLGPCSASDILYVIDVSDTTDRAEGTGKKLTCGDMLTYISNNINASSQLSDLSDATIATPSDGQLLGYSSGSWRNINLSSLAVSSFGGSVTVSQMGAYDVDSNGIIDLSEGIQDGLTSYTPTALAQALSTKISISAIDTQAEFEALLFTLPSGGAGITSMSQLESAVGVNVLTAPEVSSITQLDQLLGTFMLNTSRIDTQAEFEALLFTLPSGGGGGSYSNVGVLEADLGVNLITQTEINSLSEINAITGVTLMTREVFDTNNDGRVDESRQLNDGLTTYTPTAIALSLDTKMRIADYDSNDDGVLDDAVIPSTIARKLILAQDESAATVTPTVGDEDFILSLSRAGAQEVVLPGNATAAFTVGTILIFEHESASGNKTFVAEAGGATLNPDTVTSTRQFNTLSFRKSATNTWRLLSSGSTNSADNAAVADTATYLAQNPTNCSSGNAPLGIDDQGRAEGCFDVATQVELDASVVFPSQEEAGTTFNPDLTDVGYVIELSGEVDQDIEMPVNATVAFPLGTVFRFKKTSSSGTKDVIIEAGGALDGSCSLTTTRDMCIVRKYDTNAWAVDSVPIRDEQDASEVPFTPAGNTVATDVQAAIEEVQSELDGVSSGAVTASSTTTLTNKSLDGDNNTISNLAHGQEVDNPSSGVHGVTGSVVGTTDTQTLTNKTIDPASNTFANFPVVIQYFLSDQDTDLTTGTAKLTVRVPFAFTLTDLRAGVNTAPVGSTIEVDVNEGGTTVLSTVLSIDASEETSETAATAAVISDSAIADDAEITFDIDQIGSGTAGKGLWVTLYGTRSF